MTMWRIRAVILGIAIFTYNDKVVAAEDASCSSEATKSLVLDIYQNKILGPSLKLFDMSQTKFELAYIRTSDRKQNSAQCKAELQMHLVFVPGFGDGGAKDTTEQLEYTVEITDDGQPYVSIKR